MATSAAPDYIGIIKSRCIFA